MCEYTLRVGNQIQSVLFSHKNKKASKIRIRLRVETEEGLTGELL